MDSSTEGLNQEQRTKLRERQAELITLLEALAKLDGTKEWKVLKELVFDKSVASIERQLQSEALAPEINLNKLYKLQGEWVWAKQHSDMGRFVDTLKTQLEDIKKKLT